MRACAVVVCSCPSLSIGKVQCIFLFDAMLEVKEGIFQNVEHLKRRNQLIMLKCTRIKPKFVFWNSHLSFQYVSYI